MKSIIFLSAIYYLSVFQMVNGQHKPVTPKASPEAAALLEFLYSISGEYTLTGQHSYPATKGRNYDFAAGYIGETPVLYSTDMGFAKEGDTDSYLARPDIVKEAIRQHQNGAIVTLCWHSVPPTADEPVTFRPLPGANPDSLASVQGQLTDQQFKDVLTPGTKLYKKWCQQVDSVAFYLKQLQDAHVPVLWRPYHEMNGSWFWWGGRTGEYSTERLYRQLFDRLVKHHKLNNLIWVWNVDRPGRPEMQFSKFYPGNEYMDIVSLDVYGSDFNKTYYDSLMQLSHGKPLALGEVGNPPASSILEEQPWIYYATWAGMVRNTTRKQYDDIVTNPHILNMEDSAYRKKMDPYRAACKLPSLPEVVKKVDLSGNWVFSEEKSQINNSGAAYLPYRLEITQNDELIHIKKIIIPEYIENRTEEVNWTLDGKEIQSELQGSPVITTVNFSPDMDSLLVVSKVRVKRDGRDYEMVTEESWSLSPGKNELIIHQTSDSFRSQRNITMVFNRNSF